MPPFPMPDWWDFELELSPHVEERMVDRGFTEIDLRVMLESAKGIRPSQSTGRWVVETVHDGAPWEVILEPDERDRVIVVITAFRVA